eukprot:5677136-Amphidinium_carterae.2
MHPSSSTSLCCGVSSLSKLCVLFCLVHCSEPGYLSGGEDFVPSSTNEGLDKDFLNITADVPECVDHSKFHDAVNMVLKEILGIASAAKDVGDSQHLPRATQLVNTVLKLGSTTQKEGASYLQSLVCFVEAKCIVHEGLTKAEASYIEGASGCHADVVTWAEETAKEWSVLHSRFQAFEQLAEQGQKHGLQNKEGLQALKDEMGAVPSMLSTSLAVIFTKAVEDLNTVIAPHKSWRDTVTQTTTWENCKAAAAGLFDEAFIKSLKKTFGQAHKVVHLES